MSTANTPTVLTINPGSTSTKLGFFDRQHKLAEWNIPFKCDTHRENVADEFPERLASIEEKVLEYCSQHHTLKAVVGRGGPLKPLPGGVYKINENMLSDLKTARYSNHASNLGAILADYFARRYRIPAFIVDPVTVDDMDPIAKVSGYPGIQRKSRSHALNIRATVRKVCDQENWDIGASNFVVAHLGGGISIAAVLDGKIRDVNDGLLGMGPFSPERAGALPIGAVVELSTKIEKDELLRLFSRESGLKAYLGTSDAREVEQRIARGDKDAEFFYQAMLYQIKKEIGAMYAVCNLSVNAVIITGGLAHSEYLRNYFKNVLKNVRLIFSPGENELEAMADGAFRALDNKIEIREYVS